jgi:hypothetical protein
MTKESQVRILRNIRQQIGHIASLAVKCVALLICTGLPSQAQTLPCSWPVEATGSGITNVAFPDTDATYWLMPVDTTLWTQMIVRGQYPRSRFFSFVTYFETGGAVASIVDDNIAPDPGSSNPFAPGPAGGSGNYTVTIDGNATGSGNHIQWANTKLTYVVYRIYVADKGLGRMAGVPLPSVTLVDGSGDAYPINSCAPVESATGLANLKTLLSVSLNRSASARAGDTSCSTSQPPEQDAVTFVTSSGGSFLPNPATKYVAARGLCLQPDEIVVVRGKAAVFPNTYNGGTIFQPAIPGGIQMRYWSMCNNDQRFPFPVVACQADHATQLDDQGYYTYVISPDESGMTPPSPPSWVPPGVTWLPWGDPTVPNDLLFREMLPMPNFSLTGNYYPKGVFCPKELFIAEGWQGCFASAGATEP